MYFTSKIKSSATPVGLSAVVQELQNILNSNQIVSPSTAKAALAMESIRDDQIHSLVTANQTLTMAVESIADKLGVRGKITDAQVQAAAAAGILAGDPMSFYNHKTTMPASSDGLSIVTMVGLEDVASNRIAMEAYDDRENRNAAVYSISYNMQAARQDEFGETFFPTIVVTPDNVGFGITVRLMMVYNELNRQVSGALDQYNKKNIIRAIADYTILKNEMTRIVPVVRTESTDKFVDSAIVAPYSMLLEDESITTAPLATGVKMSLLGISQTDALLANGVLDITDSIDPGIVLQNIYVQVTGVDTNSNPIQDVLVFDVSNLPLSQFTYSTQNNYRVMTLNFSSTSLLINKFTKNVDGSPLSVMSGIVSGDYVVRLSADVSGSVNIELGDTVVYGNQISIHSVTNSSGTLLDTRAAPANAIVAAFSTAKIVGYDIKAYRTNANRRQRGQLIDTTEYTQLYNIPLRNPITAIHPMTADSQGDVSDLSSLITATRIRTSNAAVTALLNTATILSDYVDSRDASNTGPDVLGVGRFFVIPTFASEDIDMNTAINSLTSTDRPSDIQAVLVNKIRDHAYRMYRDSEYKAAADARNGGISQVPTVIIGTDPVLARYLTVTGDLRTLGGEFDVKIVSTLDKRVAGKIFITFGVFDENRNVEPNPLNFGNMAWSPELTIILPISRGGQISREIAVSPRFLHVTHCPILAVLNISNVPDVINGIPIKMQTVI